MNVYVCWNERIYESIISSSLMDFGFPSMIYPAFLFLVCSTNISVYGILSNIEQKKICSLFEPIILLNS